MPVLTGVDILGIQNYVFASNRLRDTLSASWMVEHVTSRDSLAHWGLAKKCVLLSAGGNAIVQFDGLKAARDWTASYTHWLWEAAPGLEAVVAHRSYDEGQLALATSALQIVLARNKLERVPNAPQLGLSVTASCSATGLPATGVDQGDLVSPRVQRLREKMELARHRWAKFLPATLENAEGWRGEFPLDLDLLGRSNGDTSLVGVVHVDGNSVGSAIQKWLERCIDQELPDEDVWRQFGEWSGAIDSLGASVLRAVVNRAAGCVFSQVVDRREECYLRGTPEELSFRLFDRRDQKASRARANTVLLPIRPILLGGDDITFVCDGRIALDLATTALREFEKHPIPWLGDNNGEKILTACAGVALAKVHAPFHRSYELAEDLCRTAKRKRHESNQKAGGDTGCWVDWHAGTARPGDSVRDIRERQYKRGSSSLTMRPYPLAQLGDRSQSWQWLDEELLGPGKTANESFRGFRIDKQSNAAAFSNWSGSRNRVKRLAAILPAGAAEVTRQIEAWRKSEADPDFGLPGGLAVEGYMGPETPLLDAIELMDIHIRLERDPAFAGKDAVEAEDPTNETSAREKKAALR